MIVMLKALVLAKQAGVQRLIHISALNASEDSPSQFLQSKVNVSYVTLISEC